MLLPRTVPWLWEPLQEQPGNELCSCSVEGRWHQTLVHPPAGQSNTLASTLWYCSTENSLQYLAMHSVSSSVCVWKNFAVALILACKFSPLYVLSACLMRFMVLGRLYQRNLYHPSKMCLSLLLRSFRLSPQRTEEEESLVTFAWKWLTSNAWSSSTNQIVEWNHLYVTVCLLSKKIVNSTGTCRYRLHLKSWWQAVLGCVVEAQVQRVWEWGWFVGPAHSHQLWVFL